MKKILLAAVLVIAMVFIKAKGPSPANVSLTHNSAPLSFLENKGQVMDQNRQPRPDIQFSIKAAPGLNIFIGNGAIHYQFNKADSAGTEKSSSAGQRSHPPLRPLRRGTLPRPGAEEKTATYTMYRMDVELIGANANAEVVTEQKQDYYENYFNERTGEHGATAYTYNRITYKNIYPNIDWVLYMKDGQLEHEFVIHEGGKASDLQLKYGGATGLKVNADGSLTATTPQGIITEQAPKSYQPDGAPVKSGFKLSGDILSYETGGFTGEMVIDPSLIWSTYYGGNGNDDPAGVATDGAGNVYLAGGSSSTTGIASTGAYQTTIGSSIGNNAFIAKFNSSGRLLWATYYGGSGNIGAGVPAIDNLGNVFISGGADSGSAIITTGAYQATCVGGYDNFLAKFNSAGALLWATYYGGRGDDNLDGFTTDGLGNAYLTGWTFSTSGIATAGAFETVGDSVSGESYLAKFSGTGALVWATYYGGSGSNGSGVVTDASENIYMIGATGEPSGVATTGAYQSTIAGDADAFLVKFNSSGSRLWCTYYGGSNFDISAGAAIDSLGNVYFTGYTYSINGIATAGAFQTTYAANAGSFDAFLVKFNSAGARQWGTYYGGRGGSEGIGVAIDRAENVYTTGIAFSNGMATPGAYQTVTDTVQGNGYLAEFSSTGTRLWATYFGSTGGYDAQAQGVAIDQSGAVYLTGITSDSSGAIATSGAYQTAYAGDFDGFLAKFSNCVLPTVSLITGPTTLCALGTITLTDTTTGGTWGSSNTNLATVSSGEVSGVAAGLDTIIYSVTNGCGTTTVSYPVTVNAAPTVNAVANQTVCAGDTTTTIHFTGTGTGTVYNWTCNNTSIGLAASGTGNIGSFTAVNTGNTPVVAQVTVTAGGGGYAYIANEGDSSVSVINTSTNAVVDTIHVGYNPTYVSVSPDGGKVYIVNSSSETISVINTSTNTVMATINLSFQPSGIVVTPDASKVYVANGQDSVYAINSATNIVFAAISTGSHSSPEGLAVSPDGSKIYVANYGAGNVSVISTANNTITATINIGSLTAPWGIALTPDGSKCYVANYGSNSISVINTSTNSITTTISVGAGPLGVAVSPDGSSVYVANSNGNSVSVINTATNLVTATIPASLPFGVSVNSDGSKLFVANHNSSNVSVVNTYTNTVIDTVATGVAPFSVGNFITPGNGCPGTPATFTITVNPTPTATYTTSTGRTNFCQGDSLTLTAGTETGYLWSTGATTQSIVVKQGGNEGVTVTDNHGCTASTSENISAFSVPTSSIMQGDTSFCQGGNLTLTSASQFQYLWSTGATTQNIVVSQAGSYTVKATNPVGCSNTSAPVIVTVNALPAAAINGPTSICANLSATLTASGGTGYSWSNGLGTNAQVTVSPVSNTTYTVTVTDAHSCIATAQQTVSVTSAPTASITGPAHICYGYDVILYAHGGNTYAWSGGLGTADSIEDFPGQATTYTVTVSIGANCSATASQTVNVYPEVFINLFDTICAGQTYPFGNRTLSQSGAYNDTLQTAHGCDSVIFLQLTVSNAAQTTSHDTICKGAVVVFHNQSLSQSGIYYDTLQGSGTCDSIVVLNLTVDSGTVKQIDQSICSGYSYQFHHQALNQSGTYFDTLQTSHGCDSVVVLFLVVDTPGTPTIVRHGDTLETQLFSSYQWLLNGTVAAGNAQSIVVTQNGNYSVAITGGNGCADTSALLNVTGLGVNDVAGGYGVKLYPNPNNGSFMLEFTDDVVRDVEVTDAVGRTVVVSSKVMKQQVFNLDELAAGIYILHIKTAGTDLRSLKFSVVR